MAYSTPGAAWRRGSSHRCLVSMVSKAGDMLRSCRFVDLVKCRGLAASVVGCAETRCAEACCAEAFKGDNAGVSAAIVVVDLGRTVLDARLQDMVPCIVSKGWKKGDLTVVPLLL